MYCTIQDLRAEGVTVEQANDARLEELIGLATDYIDAICGQWFEPRNRTVALDGNGASILALPVFAFTVTEVKVDGTAITDYRLYNRFVPDDRQAPTIYRADPWPAGVQNIEITGTWGYVDQNSSYEPITPSRIKRCCMRLVLHDIALLTDQAGQEGRRRMRIVSETTDGHGYTLAPLALFPQLTGDPDIDEVLNYYRRPGHMELV